MFSFYARCSARAPLFKHAHSCRHFTNTALRAKPAAKVPSVPAASSHATIEKGHADRIQVIAGRILQAGRDELYRNTASNGYVAASLSVLVLSYCGIGYLYSTRLWQDAVAKARGLPWYVPKAYQATMVCWGVLAAYAFTRTMGLVKSIKLVKSGNRVLVETSIRRPIPFMRPEKHLSEPHDLVIDRAKLYGAAFYEDMITAPEGNSFITKFTRRFFYTPFHNTRKSLGGVGLVPIQVGPVGSQRHLFIDADGQFASGGKDLLDVSKDGA